MAGAGTGNSPCAQVTVPLPTLSGDETIAVGAEPFHREHGADDVDDRVDGADLVQVDAVERHVVNRGFGFGEPVEQRDGARLPGRRQRRTTDVALDVGEAVMIGARRRVALAHGCDVALGRG